MTIPSGPRRFASFRGLRWTGRSDARAPSSGVAPLMSSDRCSGLPPLPTGLSLIGSLPCSA